MASFHSVDAVGGKKVQINLKINVKAFKLFGLSKKLTRASPRQPSFAPSLMRILGLLWGSRIL